MNLTQLGWQHVWLQIPQLILIHINIKKLGFFLVPCYAFLKIFHSIYIIYYIYYKLTGSFSGYWHSPMHSFFSVIHQMLTRSSSLHSSFNSWRQFNNIFVFSLYIINGGLVFRNFLILHGLPKYSHPTQEKIEIRISMTAGYQILMYKSL